MKVFVSIPKATWVFNAFLPPKVLSYSAAHFEMAFSPCNRHLTPEEFSLAVKDADAVVTCWGHPRITYEMLSGSKVKVIAHTGGSVADLVDQSLYDNGIRVISGNLLYAESVAEGTIAYILSGLRHIPDYVNLVKSGGWETSFLSTEGLLDQTVGIVGFGTISRILIEMLQPFRVKIKIYSSHEIPKSFLEAHHAQQVPLNEIFSSCKVVSIHTALTEKSRGFIGKKQFDLLQQGALFINTARGALIQEDEMIEALEGHRFYAVLDVYRSEPLPADSPLRKMDHVYCVPHKAGPTQDRWPRISKLLFDDLLKYFSGQQMELEINAHSTARMTKNS